MISPYFLTVCLNPTFQKTIILNNFSENEVNRSDEYYLDIAGKGINVSRVLNQLGECVIHLTQAGGRQAAHFLQMAAQEGIKVESVQSGSEIRYCHTIINKSKHTTTEIVEESEKVTDGTETLVLEKYFSLLPGCHTVIISGTKARGFTGVIFPQMVKAAIEASKTVVLDYRGDDLLNSLQYRPQFIKPNFSEFCSTFLPHCTAGENHFDENSTRIVGEKMVELFERYGTVSIVTRGKFDILFIEKGEVLSLPVQTLVPVNTIGCGDAFTAGFASAFFAKKNMVECVEKGRNCATLNAMNIRPGTIENHPELPTK